MHAYLYSGSLISSNYDYFYFGIPFQPLTICSVLQPTVRNQPFLQKRGCLNLQFIIKSHSFEGTVLLTKFSAKYQ